MLVCAVLCAVVLTCSTGQAQDDARVPPLGRTDDLPLMLPKEPTPVPPISPEGTPSPGVGEGKERPTPGLRVFVREIKVTGSTAFKEQELAAITAPYRNREVSSEDLEALRRALTLHYVNKGYINSGAVLPDQEITGGIVTFRIVEGQLTTLEVEGNRWLRESYYKKRIALGADPQAAALWLASDVQKILKREGQTLAGCPVSPERLAELLELIGSRRIHGRIAKQVLEVVFEEDKPPGEIIAQRGWEQIVGRDQLEPLLEAVLAQNPRPAEQLAGGDSKPLSFLIGAVMKKTSGRADPAVVKALLQERFGLSFVQVLSMGGAIAGRSGSDGEVSPGDLQPVIAELAREGGLPRHVRFEELEISRILSEEINPEDWAALACALDGYLRQDNVTGVVVAHGTDTLAYTASLLFWLFPEPAVPVVLTASLGPEGAAAALREAILAATSQSPGIYVALEGRLLSPLNVKFERVAPGGFRNWNLKRPLHRAGALALPTPLPAGVLADRAALRERLERAIAEACIIRVYPGLRAEYLIALMNAGVRHFILELYDTGTANLRESPFSLRRAFAEGRERGVRFFCTSQQEGIVDFSGYVTSHELWREGAIPMGFLTTESAYTRLLAAQVASDAPEDVLRSMEEADADAAG